MTFFKEPSLLRTNEEYAMLDLNQPSLRFKLAHSVLNLPT
jgi:hypothetical protein